MQQIKKLLRRIRKSYDYWNEDRKLRKLTNAIWKYSLKDSIEPKFTKEDAETLAIAIAWNDADQTKKVLSYTNEFGTRIFFHNNFT